MEETEPVDFAIIVAKDHEKDSLDAFLAEKAEKTYGLPLYKQIIQTNNGAKGDIYYSTFNLKNHKGEDFSCAITYLSGQGFSIDEFLHVFLDKAKPRFLTTVGICGADDKWNEKAIFIKEAHLVKSRFQQYSVEANYNRYGSYEVWRPSKDTVVKPEDAFKVLTLNEIDDKVMETLEEYKEVKVCAIDMEIGVIWDSLNKYNNEKKTNIVSLMAVKGVSDSGNKEQRDKRKPAALKNALTALFDYIDWLMNKFISPSKKNTVSSSTNTTSNNNNNCGNKRMSEIPDKDKLALAQVMWAKNQFCWEKISTMFESEYSFKKHHLSFNGIEVVQRGQIANCEVLVKEVSNRGVTIQSFVNALKDPDVGMGDIADELVKKYC